VPAPIHILNASSLSHDEVETIALTVQAIFGQKVTISRHKLDLKRAYDGSRQQYNSSALLAQLLAFHDASFHKLLALVDVDLFVPVLTFVYGEAQLDGVAAIVSVHRLNNGFYGVEENRSLFLERVTKEIVHELCHTFGLFHCRQFECVMRSSTYVEEIDLKKEVLCDECSTILYHKVQKFQSIAATG